jgi:DNA-binding transcriptional regulator YhcF (GntR family)
VKPRHLNEQEWNQVRLEYETSPERPSLRQLADKHCISRSTIFKRAAREGWKQNAVIVDATRQQIVRKMEAKLEAEVDEVAQLAAKQLMTELQPWIEREKVEHVKRVVRIVKRGFQRIEKIWDENPDPEVRVESLAAATLDKHDAIIRRNLGMNETQGTSGTLNVHVLLAGGRTVVDAQQPQCEVLSQEHT